MTTLIFPDAAAYDAFEAKMRQRAGLPKPGRNAATGEVVDPGNLTGKGWTTRATDAIGERVGTRVMARVRPAARLDASDAARTETRAVALAKFGAIKATRK